MKFNDLIGHALVPPGTKLRDKTVVPFLWLQQLVGVLAEEEDTDVSGYKKAGIEGDRFTFNPRDLNLHRIPTPQGLTDVHCSPLSGTGIPGRQQQLLAATPAGRLSQAAAGETGTQLRPGQIARGRPG